MSELDLLEAKSVPVIAWFPVFVGYPFPFWYGALGAIPASAGLAAVQASSAALHPQLPAVPTLPHVPHLDYKKTMQEAIK